MDVDTLLQQAKDTITVKRVFGEPVERDGVLVIPAAAVRGGGGGGSGSGPNGEGSGDGGGFGIDARPVGAFVVRDGEVTWRPAVDVTRVVLGGQIVAIVGFLTLRAVVRSWSRRRRRVAEATRSMPGDWPVFDVDSHFMEPPDLWRDHIDAAFADRSPVGSDDRGRVVIDRDRHFPTVRWRRLAGGLSVAQRDVGDQVRPLHRRATGTRRRTRSRSTTRASTGWRCTRAAA